ncbi:UDP-GlcNAc:undecaprenyl-phosphate/decaprenyl-phosphate GlcNAc-1-phosphate transferase [Phycisphaerales bacterium]|nr:UDP-GlcNAc:undecaprenyl-phosphate/decaprenyl-phosphate GlcNAc-1-phosphate transferase [Phycisphaerales bacterium]
MIWLCLALIVIAFLVALPTTAVIIRISRAAGALDTPGIGGQVKAPPRPVPNTGGIAIILAIVLPLLAGLGLFQRIDPAAAAEWRTDFSLIPADLHEHIAGIQQQTPLALLLIGCLALLHVLGLIDDRRPLGPFVKLAIMTLPALAVPLVTTLIPSMSETRLLTLLDSRVGGAWLSILLTAMWFLVVTNALNFIDNMDGLAAGVVAIAGSLFMAAAIVRPQPQWFVAASLALMVGACLGFLVFNWPRAGGARIFMGDSGSLVLGFLLAFLTTRTTFYAGRSADTAAWYAVLMPLVVLAVPLYDFASVVIIRLSQRRSPFVGDLQHLSHRLVQRGLSRRSSVLVIWGLTGITGVTGVLLSSATAWQAILIGVQILVILGVIAAFEYASTKGRAA